MLRQVLTLALCYCDLLRFWSNCTNKRCRRARRCLDRSGYFWNTRYPRTGPMRDRARARVRAKRRHLPQWLRDWQRRHDPSDALL